MKNFLVCYDLFGNKHYEKLTHRIERYPIAQKVMNTTYLVKVEEEETASTILESLRQVVEEDDRILVLEISRYGAQFNSLTTDSGLSTLVAP